MPVSLGRSAAFSAALGKPARLGGPADSSPSSRRACMIKIQPKCRSACQRQILPGSAILPYLRSRLSLFPDANTQHHCVPFSRLLCWHAWAAGGVLEPGFPAARKHFDQSVCPIRVKTHAHCTVGTFCGDERVLSPLVFLPARPLANSTSPFAGSLRCGEALGFKACSGSLSAGRAGVLLWAAALPSSSLRGRLQVCCRRAARGDRRLDAGRTGACLGSLDCTCGKYQPYQYTSHA